MNDGNPRDIAKSRDIVGENILTGKRGPRQTSAAGVFALALTCLTASSVLAEDGVTADKILIGQTAGQTGLVAAQVKEVTAAAQVYFAYVNKRGGVNGRKIELVSMDDGRDAKRAADNARKLITENKVFALALPRGTPTSEALVPIANEFRVPLIGPGTGALSLHQPFSRYVFNVRAKYQTEAVRIIGHLASVGITQVAIIYQNDSFGKDALVGFSQGLKERNISPVAVIPLDAAKPESSIPGAVDVLSKAQPQAVAIAGLFQPTVAFLKTMKAKGVFAQYLTLSNLSADAFIKELGSAGPGVIVTQVMPAPGKIGTPIVREYMQAVRESPALGAVSSYAAMEGFVTAKVLVEGLRRAGRNPTRAGLIQALEGMHEYDVGGFVIGYSPTNHSGSNFIDITIISKDGTFRR
jgi:ABC-type branched-subunit amino acid transport system substrate-binding protein